jgi:hypothetical protein
MYTDERQSRATWAFLSGLRNRNGRSREYRSSMYRTVLTIAGVGLALAVVLGVIVALLT